MAEECVFCGAYKPVAHVEVRDEYGKIMGRVCASHTLKELIFDRESRFLITVEYVPEKP